MLGGIVAAGYTLPGNTPLDTFVIASVAVFFLGNILSPSEDYAGSLTRRVLGAVHGLTFCEPSRYLRCSGS